MFDPVCNLYTQSVYQTFRKPPVWMPFRRCCWCYRSWLYYHNATPIQPLTQKFRASSSKSQVQSLEFGNSRSESRGFGGLASRVSPPESLVQNLLECFLKDKKFKKSPDRVVSFIADYLTGTDFALLKWPVCNANFAMKKFHRKASCVLHIV